MEELRDRINNLTINAGVYALLNSKGIIQYIGKSGELKNRLINHLVRRNTKVGVPSNWDFTILYWTEDDNIGYQEKALIDIHRPWCNEQHNPNRLSGSIKSLTNQVKDECYNLSPEQLEEAKELVVILKEAIHNKSINK